MFIHATKGQVELDPDGKLKYFILSRVAASALGRRLVFIGLGGDPMRAIF